MNPFDTYNALDRAPGELPFNGTAFNGMFKGFS
jgi:hypothetical protein